MNPWAMRYGLIAFAALGFGMWRQSAWAALMLAAIMILLDEYLIEDGPDDDE